MLLADALDDLLNCALAAIDVPVCRSFKYPGSNASHDVCETSRDGGDGQLWVAHVGSQPGWPSPTGQPTTCATVWGESIEIGIVRCAKGKVSSSGKAPDPDLITEDAEQQQADRVALRNAILCCWAVEGMDILIEGWLPIPPLGGCVGGVWTVQIRDAGCDCSTWES